MLPRDSREVSVFLQVTLGWFKFRRNSRLSVSMRERAIHRNLLEQFGIEDSECNCQTTLNMHQSVLL